MIDLNKFPMHKKPYSDHRLMSTSKKDLILYIRDIERSYEMLYELYQNSVKYGEALYDRIKEEILEKQNGTD